MTTSPPRRGVPPFRIDPDPGDQWGRFAAPVVLAVLVLLVVGGVWAVGGWLTGDSGGNRQDSSGRIKVGMHISQVGRILDNEPPPSPSYPRMRDYFPADEFGDGTIEYEGDGVELTIHFVGGYVTSIDEEPSSDGPGFHKYSVTVRQR